MLDLTGVKIVKQAIRTLLAVMMISIWCQLPALREAAWAETVPATEQPEKYRDLDTFVDTVIETQRSLLDISAVTVSIVKDGQTVFAKAYGMADRERQIPATADKSIFWIGSTSKLFTWTSVMQQLERGNLDLDTDVNSYLKTFQIPATFDEPITLRHILTHTAGFEEGVLGFLLNFDPDNVGTIEEAMAKHIPMRINEPGAYASYSNYATALAGLIVQNVSGLPFNEYVKKNIFEPLGMERSTFAAPLPADMLDAKTNGYKREAGVLKPQPYELVTGFSPAGAMATTSVDMAKFMLAHLQNGQFGDLQILKPETAKLMHSVINQPDKRLTGMAHGFYEQRVNGHILIGHGGDISQFHANMMLDKEEQLGIFVSYATETGAEGRSQFISTFYDHYYPEKVEPIIPPTDFNERAGKYAGSYQFWRFNKSTIEKALGLMRGNITVAPTGENTLLISGLGEPRQYVEIGEGLFRQVDGEQKVAFAKNDTGEVQDLYIDSAAVVVATRIPTFEGGLFKAFLPFLSFVIFLTVLVGWIYRRTEYKAMLPGERNAIRLSMGVAAANILFVISMGIVIATYQAKLAEDIPLPFAFALIFPMVAALLTVGVVYSSVKAWREGYWRPGRRIHYSLVAFASVYMTIFYYYWNILGLQYV